MGHCQPAAGQVACEKQDRSRLLFMACAVRQLDRRDPLHPCILVDVTSRSADSSMPRSLGRLMRTAVDLNSIDSPSSKPHLFAVGGSDTWVRVYDRRMTASNGGVRVRCLPHADAAVLRLLLGDKTGCLVVRLLCILWNPGGCSQGLHDRRVTASNGAVRVLCFSHADVRLPLSLAWLC